MRSILMGLLFSVLAIPALGSPIQTQNFYFTYSWDGNSNTPSISGSLPVPNLFNGTDLHNNLFAIVFDFNDVQVKNLTLTNLGETDQNNQLQISFSGAIGSAAIFMNDIIFMDDFNVPAGQTVGIDDFTIPLQFINQLIISSVQDVYGTPGWTYASDNTIEGQAKALNWKLTPFGLGSEIVAIDSVTGDEAILRIGDGTQFVFSGTVAYYIPEPSTLVMAAIGAVACCAAYRRRKS